MKMYHGFMINKIDQAHSPKLKNLVWRVIHVATGVLIYPILGVFVGLEMSIKLLNWRLSGKDHNARENSTHLKFLFFNVHGEPAKGCSLPFQLISKGSWISPILKTFREYNIVFGPEEIRGQFNAEKQQLAQDMEMIIKRFTDAYTKVYIQYFGSWEHGMKIIFQAADSSLPYCSNPLLPSYEKIEIEME
jgi:hypothetical protein